MSDQISDAVSVLADIGGLGPADRRALAEALRPRMLLAGETLFSAGSPADGMVVVDRGRLGVVDDDDEVIATMGRGDLVGEMGALTGAPRSVNVIALRDTSVLEVGQAAFDQLFDSSPMIGRALSRLVVGRLLDQPVDDHRRSVPRAVALVTIGDPADADDLASALTRRVTSSIVVTEDVTDGRTDAQVAAALEDLEGDHELVVLLTGDVVDVRRPDPGDWLDRCLRHADAVLVVVGDDHRPDADALALLGRRLASLRSTVEFVVMNPTSAVLGHDATPWIELLGPDRVHQVRTGDHATADRCARLVLGQGVGVVFSGGAAKGLAHLGAWRAMCELGVEVDAVAGVSLGALLGAGVALDYTPAELQSEVDDRLVRERGLVDLTFPWMALLRGEGVSRRIEEVARGRRFEQTWRNFVCTSCDLTSGETVEHRTGPLWTSIRASVSIPGVLPPFRMDDRLLVDGAVRSNLPIGPLRDGHPTPMRVIAVDVGKDGTLPVGETPDRGAVSGWKLVARRLDPRRPGPGVPSLSQVLMRVVEIAGVQDEAMADCVIRPDLGHLGLGDFSQIDAFARAGYEATCAALG